MSKILDIEPHKEYEFLLKQFNSIKTICWCLEQQLNVYRKKERKEYLASKLLESEKEANSLLTEEIEKLQKTIEIMRLNENSANNGHSLGSKRR